MAATANDRAIRLQEVCMRTGMGKTFIYGEIAAGRFPKPFKPGLRTCLWLDSEISEWIATRAAERHGDGKRLRS